MRCPNAKNKISGLQTFQKGVIISCKSLQRLYIYLKEKYDIKFILTHRLNQDSLESLFSQLRSRGGLNDYPTFLDALYRLRMIMLGKNLGVIVSNCNTYEIEPDEFIIAEVVKTAKVPMDIKPDPKSTNYDLYNIEEDAELTSLSSNKIINIVEEDGVEYLAGWVARKYIKDFPDLLANIQHEDHNQIQIPTWLSHLSFSGLTIPSSQWLDMVRKIEKILCRLLCKQSIFKSKNISS